VREEAEEDGAEEAGDADTAINAVRGVTGDMNTSEKGSARRIGVLVVPVKVIARLKACAAGLLEDTAVEEVE
jgi:hypothetical protein